MSFKTILAAFALVGLVTMPASAASLTAAELKALAPGSYAVSIYGFIKMTINLQPGGSITGVTSKKKRDSGYWTVDGNKLCIRWNRWLKKSTRCITLSGKNGVYASSGVSIRKI
jgi:hypothetical protein